MKPGKKEKKIGQILIDFGLINPQYLDKLLKEQLTTEELLGQMMINDGIINHDDLAKALSLQFNIPFFDIESYPPQFSLVDELPVELLSEHNFLPVKKLADKTIILISDPNDLSLINDVTDHYKGAVEFFVGNARKITALRLKYLQEKGASPAAGTDTVGGETMTFINRFLQTGTPQSAVDLAAPQGSDPFGSVDMEDLMPEPGQPISPATGHSAPPPTQRSGQLSPPAASPAGNGMQAPQDQERMDKTKGFPPDTPEMDRFFSLLRDRDRHFIICLASGEKFLGKIADFNQRFLLLDTSTGKKLFNFDHIGYIEVKTIKGGGES